MTICKRTTVDPLLQVFLEAYGLNLLSVPREDADVGSLYVRNNGRISSPGLLSRFLTPELDIPTVAKNQRMASVIGKVSSAISCSVGLSLLEGFFIALGAAAFFGKVRSAYVTGKAHSLRFSFRDPCRDSIDVGLMGSKLIRHEFNADHALINPGNRYYLVTGVARSTSISVTAATKSQDSVSLGVEVFKVADAEGRLQIKSEGEGTYTYSGTKRLAFGVELYELSYDERHGKMKMLLPEGAIRVRSRAAASAVPLLKPAFIETPDNDAFIDLN